jgi:hypothetical protein
MIIAEISSGAKSFSSHARILHQSQMLRYIALM